MPRVQWPDKPLWWLTPPRALKRQSMVVLSSSTYVDEASKIYMKTAAYDGEVAIAQGNVQDRELGGLILQHTL